MRGKLIFGAGVGIGYLLGTRAGRERFDQITGQAKRFWENNTVQEAAGVVQTQAGRLYDGGKKVVSDQMQNMRGRRHDKHNRDFGRREQFGERNRKDWGTTAPVGPPSTMGSPTNTNPPSVNPANATTTIRPGAPGAGIPPSTTVTTPY